MATATRSRAKRDMSVLAPKAETEIVTETAVAAISAAPEASAATEDVARLSSERLADAGFRDAIAEHQAHKLGLFCSVVTDDEIAESFFIRGRIAAAALLAGDADAIAAARADFPTWDGNPESLTEAGAQLRAYGHRIAKYGVRPGAKADNLKEGQFIRTEAQHRFWDVARKRWADIIKTEAQKEADRAKRSARAAESRAKKEADKKASEAAAAETMTKGNGDFAAPKSQNETFRVTLSGLQQLRAYNRKAQSQRMGLTPALLTAFEAVVKQFEDATDGFCD